MQGTRCAQFITTMIYYLHNIGLLSEAKPPFSTDANGMSVSSSTRIRGWIALIAYLIAASLTRTGTPNYLSRRT